MPSRCKWTTISIQKSLSQLDLERRWLSARITRGHRNLCESRKSEILSRIDALDLAMAATPAETAEDLLIKLEHLAEILFPHVDAISPDTFEEILFIAVLDDVRTLAGHEINKAAP